MEDPLRVLVSVDTRNAAASIEVRGALTYSNCGTLLNILRHTATLGANILINLTRTVRIEDTALEVLADAARDVEHADPSAPALHVGVQLPPDNATRGALPPPPRTARQTLDNETALDLILARDPRVLSGPRPSRTERNS